jgi:hypothetical protein
MKKTILALIFLLFVSDSLIPTQNENDLMMSMETEQEIRRFLKKICDWAIDRGVGSGVLQVDDGRSRSIFVNSNLARILIAGYEISGNQHYLDQALGWFDVLVSRQKHTTAANGMETAFWLDGTKHENIYLGDAGTAATALAGAVRYADEKRRQNYMRALELYAAFMQHGTRKDPQDKNRGGSDGWIVKQGFDRGALGCGYYRNELSTAPYTIATSNSGAAFFSALYALTGNPDHKNIAANAVMWLMKNRITTGEFPYILHNEERDNWPLDTMSYVTEGLLFAYYHIDDQELKDYLESNLNKSVQWLIIRQNKNGTWGKLRSEDQQRSPAVVNLLNWYYQNVYENPYVLKSIQRNYRYYLNSKNAERFGVFELPVATGFVGLAQAEILKTGITYRIEN